MRPDLVLDEDDKKRRFKKYKPESTIQQSGANTSSTQSHARVENESGSWSPGAGVKRSSSSSPGASRKHLKVKEETPDLSAKSSPFDVTRDDESDDGEDILEFIKQTAAVMDVNKIFSDLANNESVLDPETGLVLTEAGKERIKQEFNIPEDELIWKYIHKKFRVLKNNSSVEQDANSNFNVIKSVTVSCSSENKNSQILTNLQPRPQRKSVIVRREVTPIKQEERAEETDPGKTLIRIEFEDQEMVDLTEATDLFPHQQTSFKLSFDLMELEHLFATEETLYFQNTLDQFVVSFKTYPMGEEMMKIYINFSQNLGTLPLLFMKLISSQLR